MDVTAATGDVTQLEVPALILNLFDGVRKPAGATGAIDQALGGIISGLIDDGEITGKRGESTLIHTLGKIAPRRILVMGLGKQGDFNLDTVRGIMAEACRTLRGIGVPEIATIAHGAGIGGLDPITVAQAMTEGAILGLYRFNKYLSTDDGKEIRSLRIIEQDSSKLHNLQLGVNLGSIHANATVLARDMVNEPPNIMTPSQMANVARQIALDHDLKLQIFGRDQAEVMGMGAFLGVSRGSKQPPQFIVVSYHGDPNNLDNNIGLVGKGITFDTGGISLKPAGNMGEMKGDMAGAAAVLAAIKAIGQLQPQINVTAIAPCTENMPGGNAQRPGDIVRAMNGKSIEVENTDAEGRLALADAFCYARNSGLSRLVDVATLTGAIVVALGTHYSGGFTNNQQFMDQVLQASHSTGERIWQLPLNPQYKEQNKSNVADIKNTGGRRAGAITAAHFLAEFTEDTPWVHLDIAGTSFSDKNSSYVVKGATGIPVRTLVSLAMDLGRKSS